MGRKLYVGNLPYSVSEDELREIFGRSGGVDTVNVVRDNATGRARRFAFAEVVRDPDAQGPRRDRNQPPTVASSSACGRNRTNPAIAAVAGPGPNRGRTAT